MKRYIVSLTLAMLLLLPSCAQKKTGRYAIAFYNLENLYDTINDPHTRDEDFLPTGMYGWNTEKYNAKLKNLSKVLSEIAVSPETQQGPAIIGLAEVENRTVVEELLKQRALRSRHYRILHYDSRDRRGIDCAMLYDPREFTLEDSLYIPCIFPSRENPKDNLGFTVDEKSHRIKARPLTGDTTKITRGFLVGIGRLAGERLAVIVNHWPSRGSESIARERAGRQVRLLSDALSRCYPGIKIVIMGDLNDDPDNKSLTRALRCVTDPTQAQQPNALFNPWLYTLRTEGQGTLLYKGQWNLFDQIIVSGNMVSPNLQLGKKQRPRELGRITGLTYLTNGIFKPEYMMQKSGKSKGGPKRTHQGKEWLNGYSDHFPTYIYLITNM